MIKIKNIYQAEENVAILKSHMLNGESFLWIARCVRMKTGSLLRNMVFLLGLFNRPEFTHSA